MARLRTALGVAATSMVMAIAFAAPALADVKSTDSGALDGNLYVGVSGGGGCKLPNSGSLGACVNRDISFINRGYTSSKPNAQLYWGSDYSGAYACISPHSVWYKSTSSYKIVFDHRNSNGSTSGLNQSVWSNVASVKWSNTSCSVYP